MATDSSTPAPKVNLNLDSLEKERPKEPYTTTLRGRRITLTDPADIDWLALAEMGDDPVLFVTACMSDEDSDFFYEEPLESWKVNVLMDDFMRHFGLGGRGKSRRSSRS